MGRGKLNELEKVNTGGNLEAQLEMIDNTVLLPYPIMKTSNTHRLQKFRNAFYWLMITRSYVDF